MPPHSWNVADCAIVVSVDHRLCADSFRQIFDSKNDLPNSQSDGRSAFRGGVIGLAGLLAIALFLATLNAAAAEWTVHPGESIQTAVQAAAAGDTVQVERGAYIDHVVIDKPLRLQGVNRPTLSGDNQEELTGYFDRLAAGGTVQQPLTASPWGDTFGMLTDRYGVDWMVNIARRA